jgi:hypothetical protein
MFNDAGSLSRGQWSWNWTVMSDALRVVLNLTLPLGPLAAEEHRILVPSSQQKSDFNRCEHINKISGHNTSNLFNRLVPICGFVLQFGGSTIPNGNNSKRADDELRTAAMTVAPAIRLHAVNCLINVPIGCYDALLGSPSYDMIGLLLDFLQFQLKHEKYCFFDVVVFLLCGFSSLANRIWFL